MDMLFKQENIINVLIIAIPIVLVVCIVLLALVQNACQDTT